MFALSLTLPEVSRVRRQFTAAAEVVHFSGNEVHSTAAARVPVNAPYFDGASLLIAADCTAYAYANFHQDFIRGKVTLVGCPKLDDVDYSEKLTEILRQNNIKSVTVVRMEVPCCGGLEYAVRTALQNCGKLLPWQVKTISIKGELLDD